MEKAWGFLVYDGIKVAKTFGSVAYKINNMHGPKLFISISLIQIQLSFKAGM